MLYTIISYRKNYADLRNGYYEGGSESEFSDLKTCTNEQDALEGLVLSFCEDLGDTDERLSEDARYVRSRDIRLGINGWFGYDDNQISGDTDPVFAGLPYTEDDLNSDIYRLLSEAKEIAKKKHEEYVEEVRLRRNEAARKSADRAKEERTKAEKAKLAELIEKYGNP